MSLVKVTYANGDVVELDAPEGALLVLNDPTNQYVTGSATLAGVDSVSLEPDHEIVEEPAPEPEPAGPNATEAAIAVAHAQGIDLATVTGTGPDGQITGADVEAIATANAQAAADAELQAGETQPDA